MTLRTALVALFIAAFAMLSTACGNNDNGQDDGGFGHLAGHYFIDLSPGGMPMIIFLNIMEDGNFTLTNEIDGDDPRGAGVLGGIDGTYMLLYDDDRRATFTVGEDRSLVFSTTLPFGTVNISFPDADVVAVRVLDDRSNMPGGFAGMGDPMAGLMSGLVGEYFIDLTELGMPMTVYLVIGEDFSFELLNALVGGEVDMVDMCPRAQARQYTGPVLAKCCLLEDRIAVDGGLVVIPWGATLAQVKEGLERALELDSLARTGSPARACEPARP